MCRCTGYRPILEGLMTLTASYNISEGECPKRNNCCKKSMTIGNNIKNISHSSEFLPYDPSQEPIFPPELMVREKYIIYNVLFKINMYFKYL